MSPDKVRPDIGSVLKLDSIISNICSVVNTDTGSPVICRVLNPGTVIFDTCSVFNTDTGISDILRVYSKILYLHSSEPI